MSVTKLSAFTKDGFELCKLILLVGHNKLEHVNTRPFVNLVETLTKYIQVISIHNQKDKLTLRFTLRPVK